MAVGVTALLLAVSDGMSDWITHSSHADTEFFVRSMVKVYAATGTLAVPPFLELVAAITAVAGAFLVWLELTVGASRCLASRQKRPCQRTMARSNRLGSVRA